MTPTRRAEPKPWHWWAGLLALAAVVYPPLLATEPGAVVADTKSYLYLDPGRLLERAVSMWDPHVGLGTVPHQQIGYLWPIGPYYWLMDQIGAPDWVAQRIWIGTIMVAAGGGVLFLTRTWRWRPTAAIAAAFVYALTPFVLTLGARISVILLPYVGLPWLLALTIRALRTKGWRHPALFGLVVATVGTVNATALLLVGIVPVGWIIYSMWGAEKVSRARATTTAAKIGVITLAVNLWWVAGLSVQATNGINVLAYTETAEVVANSSTAPEVLRGLGYWFFYGGDRLGPWIEPSVDYTQHLWLIALSYALPIGGLLALGLVRWRHRLFVVAMLLVGLVIAVGAHPWGDPSLVGSVFKAFLSADVGLAMRSLPRAVPLVALALALGLGATVAAAWEQVPRRGIVAAVGVCLLAYGALPPLWTRQFVPANLQRDEDIPQYWEEAADYLDQRDDGTRVLEIPGIDFASYRWGNTVDPITPGLMDRPYAARELIPYGSPASADLLNALDLRFQEQTMTPEGIAAVARLLSVGDIVTRNDLQYERYNTPRPRSFWDLVSQAPGLGAPTAFGPTTPNVPVDEAPLLDEDHLAGDAALADPPAVGVFPVENPTAIVRTASADRSVLLSGDGAGIVDAAMAGLIDGHELLRYSASLTEDPDFVLDSLVGDQALIVTDTNRARAERWTTVRHTQGYTESVEGGLLRRDITDNRLPVFADRPGIATVAEYTGISARATGYGNPITYTPEERPANAVDGDLTTAWRTGAFSAAIGERIELTADAPVTTGEIAFVQPTTGEINRWITEVELRFDGEDPIKVALSEASRRSPGEVVRFDERTFTTVSITITADTAGVRPGYGGLTSVGFAEIGVAGLTADEIIRMPQDLLDAGGYRTIRYPLALVQTRQRSIATDVTREDEERAMTRAVDLPAARDYALAGTARLSPRASSAVLDQMLGRLGVRGGQASISASSFLPGSVAALPSMAFDGDPATRWTSAFATPDEEFLRVDTPTPLTASTISLTAVDDDDHSVPQALTMRVDGGAPIAVALVPSATAGDLVTLTGVLPQSVVGTEVVVAFDAVQTRTTIDWNSGNRRALPVSIAEVDLGGVAVKPLAKQFDSGCRTDLVRVDGEQIAVRVAGETNAAMAGHPMPIVACDGPVSISGGDHRFRTTPGRDTGLDVDQLVWCSAAGGPACGADQLLLPAPAVDDGPLVSIQTQDDSTIDVEVTGATPGQPFWLVLGQSQNPGWEIIDTDDEHSPSQLVNGYANGFLVTPDAEAMELTMRFTPQNRVDVALLLSGLGVIAALILIALSAKATGPAPIPLHEPLRRLRAFTWEGALPTRRDAIVVGLLTGVMAGLISTPLLGLVVGVVAGFATRREGWRPIFTIGPAIVLSVCALYIIGFQFRNNIGPGLHWPQDTGRLHPFGILAVVLLAVDVVIEQTWQRRSDYR